MANRILIITDDPSEAKAIKEILDRAQEGLFDTECVTRLSAALERLRMGGVDAVIVDLSLPDSHGVDTFEQLFAAIPHTPILTLNAIADETLAIAAAQRGAQGYLWKGNLGIGLVPQALCTVIQRKLVEEAMFKEKSRAEIALNSISDAVICTDLSGAIDYLNLAAEHLTGWSKKEARGRLIGDVFQIVNDLTRQPARNPVDLVLQEGAPTGLGTGKLLIRKDGSEVAIGDSAAPIHNWSGQITGTIVVFHDVGAARVSATKTSHLAQHDFLTDLPNRVLLKDRIAQAIILAKRHAKVCAVLFLDLDNFKHVNDALGHSTGDKLLQSVARRLIACVRGSDTVSRDGGDEFAILLGECAYEEDIALMAGKVLAALALPHTIAGHELHVTTSIGIGVYPVDGEDAETLVKNADSAMSYAKGKGRNNYQFFRNDMNIRAIERQLIESSLRLALERQEFFLSYQPKINLETDVVTGAEALLRWRHPERGILNPDQFVPIAEDSGLIVPIGRWVLREACMQAKRWMDEGLGPLSMAVNISSLEFRQPGFLDGVSAILRDTGLEPSWLQLEINESILTNYAKSSVEILHELKILGVIIAVDDFGTGYSHLDILKKYPIDVLKIDQSFVCDIGMASDEGTNVSAVIGMGNTLKKQVIIQGIENKSQLAFLKARNCEEGQGYLFSRPLPPDQFAALPGITMRSHYPFHPSGIVEALGGAIDQ